MNVNEWMQTWFDDRTRFDSVSFGWAPADAQRLRGHVSRMLEDLALLVESGSDLRAQLADLRGEPQDPGDFVRASRGWELCALLVAKSVRERLCDDAMFHEASEALRDSIDAVVLHHEALSAAAEVVRALSQVELDIRELRDDGDAILGRVADAAYRTPMWTWDDAVLRRSAGVLVACDKAMALHDFGLAGAVRNVLAAAQSTGLDDRGVPKAPLPPTPPKET